MIKIIGIPSVLGCNTLGCNLAPQALRDSNLLKAFLLSNIDVDDLGDLIVSNTLSKSKAKAKNLDKVIQLTDKTINYLCARVKDNDKVLSIGGDHSIAISTIFTSTNRFDDSFVLWIDAHADSNSPETSPSGNIHGMPVSTVLGDSLFNNFSQKSLNKNNIVLLGIKDVDAAEWEYIKNNNITVYTIEDIVEKGIGTIWKEIKEKIGNRPLHVSLDIDGLDNGIAPGTGIINRGGINYREIKYIAKECCKQNLIALDVTEINPRNDINNKTLELAVELILDFFGGKWTEYEKYLATQS